VSDSIQTEAPSRNKSVLGEISKLGAHPWAGVYRTAGTWPVVLSIAPEAGFTLYKGSWCGNCARYIESGSVLSADGSSLKLRIDLAEPDNTSEAWFELDSTLHFVRWGDLLFAVQRTDLSASAPKCPTVTRFPTSLIAMWATPVTSSSKLLLGLRSGQSFHGSSNICCSTSRFLVMWLHSRTGDVALNSMATICAPMMQFSE